MVPVGMIAGTAIGAAQLGYGIHQMNQAKKAAAANVMPTYRTPAEEQQMLALAQSRAGQGISDASRQAYMSASDRALNTGINNMLRSGGSANAVSTLVGNTQQQAANMALFDDQVRMQNLQNLQNQLARQSANADKRWQINEYAPWANRSQAIAQNLAAANNAVNAGIGALSSGIIGGASVLGNKVPQQPAQPYQFDTMQVNPIGASSQQQMPTYMPGGYSPTYVTPPNINTDFSGGPFGMLNDDMYRNQVPQFNGITFIQ